MAGEVRADIPPTAVPRFPVLRLTWRQDGTITLDDTTIAIPEGTEARVAALTACAEHALERGGDQPTIRVIAVDENSGQTWPMGVTGEGDIVELESATDDAEREQKKTHSRRSLLAAGAIAGATLLGGGGVAAAFLVRSRQEPEPTVAPPPPGNGDLVPVAVPDGYSATAAWSVAVTQNSPVTALTDGRTLTIAPDTSNLRAHDPATGKVAWTGTGNSSSLAVDEVVIDGRPFLIALDNSGVLKLWPLDQGPTIAATDIELSSRDAVLHTSGAAPAVSLPTQVGYIFDGPDGIDLDIPVGYQLISATPDGQAVILGKRDWALLTPGQTTVENPTELLLPSKSHSIAGGFMLGNDRLLVRQDGPDQSQWALYATDASNAILTAPASRAGNMPTPGDLLHTPDRLTWALDGLVATADSLAPIEDATITAVTEHGIYADGSDGPVLIHPRSGDHTTLPEDITAPSVVADDHAVIVADKLDTTTAYTVEVS